MGNTQKTGTKNVGRLAAAALLGASALAVATPAHAAAPNIYIVDGSYSDCRAKQRTYVSSWTKITKACFARTDLGPHMWQFEWKSIA